MGEEDHLLTFRRSFRFIVAVLSLIGYNPRRRGVVLGLVLTTMCTLSFTLCAYFLYANREVVDAAIFSLLFTVNTSICVCKCMALIINKKSFEELIEFFDLQLPIVVTEVGIRRVVDCRITNAKILTYTLFTSNFIILIPVVLNFLIIKTEGRLPIEYSHQLTNFYMLDFAVQSFGYMSSAIISSLFDSLYITCCQFTTAQIDVLIHEIEKIECDFDSDPRAVRTQLIKVLEKHSLIIRSNALFNDSFGLALFVQLFVSTVGLCFSLMQPKKLSSILLIPAQLLQITLFCYFGQKINERSSALAMAFYNTPWIYMKPAERKWVLIGLRQAQKPLYSKASPIRNMSHESLKSVFQATYSIYAVLKKIDD